MLIDKHFQGNLDTTSTGQMLTASTNVKDSAGYVALERVSGSLHGRTGNFVLQHSGTISRGSPRLIITIVPASGTDQLSGLTGKMAITIAAGKHLYKFDYPHAEMLLNG